MFVVALILAFSLLAPQVSAHSDEQLETTSVVRDSYIFNSNEDQERLIVAAVVTELNPDLLYQFNFDTNRDGVEDRVIQAFVTTEGDRQVATVTGPSVPERTGETISRVKAQELHGDVSTTASPIVLSERGTTIRAFVGRRDDPIGGEHHDKKNVDLIAMDLPTSEILAERKPDFDFWVSVYRRGI